MLRTLVFGVIAGIVGKKLYDNGSIDRFGDDLKTRLGEAKESFDSKVAEKRLERAGAVGEPPRTSTAPKSVKPATPVS